MASHAAPLTRSLPSTKVPAGAVAGVAALALIGAGTFAAWTSTTSATTGTYTAATVTSSDVDANGTTFTSAISNLLPGDYAYRYRTLSNTGSVAQTFTGAVTGTGTLATTTGGLTIQVDKCTVPWTTVSTLSTCAGTPTAVLASTGVSTSPAISFGSVAASTGVLYLRYTLALPSGASQATFQGTTGTVTVATTGATAAASDRT